MTMQTSLEVVEGEAVVVKRAVGGAAETEALRTEGERLRRACHPGVVSVLRSAPITDGWELVMRHGGRCLSTLGGATEAQLAAIVAGVASTLADLHELGITHGRIDASHVLVTDNGRPMLCGFGDGQQSSAPEDDVAMLGALLEGLLGSDDQPEPIPDRRWRRRRGWDGWERRALLLLADQAAADEPSRRPTARRLAAAVAEAVPSTDHEPPMRKDEQVPTDPMERLRPETDSVVQRRPRRALGAVMTIVGIAFAIVAVHRSQSVGERPLRRSGVDAPGELRIAEPAVDSVVVADGKRYRVGQDGDRLLIGDWSCDGEPTLAAFRPSTHQVFVFDRWAVDEPFSVGVTATVPRAIAMLSASGRDGCPSLSLQMADGALVPVSLDGIR